MGTELKYADLFIDFDDTIYDTHGNAVIALAELFAAFHLERYFPTPSVFYEAYWNANTSLWAQYAKGTISRSVLMVERFRQPLSLGIDKPEPEFCMKVNNTFLDLCSCKTGVVEGSYELLDYLKEKGYRLHVCSNGFHEVQYKKLEASRLLSYFTSVILSEDAGANKPDKAFFDYAMRTAHAERERTIMIGDNFYTDIMGAKNSGIDTIFFNRWDADFIPPEKPTYMVRKLCEIKDML